MTATAGCVLGSAVVTALAATQVLASPDDLDAVARTLRRIYA